MLLSINELKEALSNLAWDCHSGWLDSDGVKTWSDTRVKTTANNIIESLTNNKETE